MENMIITDFTELESRLKDIAKRFAFHSSEITLQIEEQVRQIIMQIHNEGLKGFQELSLKHDAHPPGNPWIDSHGAFERLLPPEKRAIKAAAERIQAFQKLSLRKFMGQEFFENGLGICFKPIERVGVYVPGGAAPLFSSLLMTLIPAQVAGVEEIVVSSPPPVHPLILAVADYLGVQRVLQGGGAQAIAAMALGLKEIELAPVDKIVGPGNVYVTMAKKLLLGQVGIDALYGPSEIFVIADHTAQPKGIALDLLSQLEHGSGMEAAIFLSDSRELIDSVLQEFGDLLESMPRKAMIEKAWSSYGLIGHVQNLKQAALLSNLFAPEHLEIKASLQETKELLKLCVNAGAIFSGKSCEALGDYLAGPSHCLPTGRSARYSSGLSVRDFFKQINLIEIEPSLSMVEDTARLARMEGLEAHALAAEHSLENGTKAG